MKDPAASHKRTGAPAAVMDRYLLCATFPRSGHNLLVEALLRYYGSTGFNSEDHCGIIRSGPLVYCEHYTHCGRIPCTDSRTNIQKTHDFNLKVIVPVGADVVVQYRTPVESIVSHYRLARSRGNISDSMASWRAFAARSTQYWQKFIAKWVVRGPRQTVVTGVDGCEVNPKPEFISYHDFVADPVRYVSTVFNMLFPDEIIDPERLTNALGPLAIRPRFRMKSFDYYDASYFAEIEGQCRDLMLQLNLPPCVA